MKKWKIALLAFVVLDLIVLIIYPWSKQEDNFFGEIYQIEDLIGNYEQNGEAIHELVRYSNSLAAGKGRVKFWYNSNKFFTVLYTGGVSWSADIKDSKFDSLIHTVGWSKSKLEKVEELLDESDCIEIELGNPAKVTYRFSGLARFSYNIFSTPLTTSQITQYNDSCRYIYYQPTVVLEFGGGAVGPQCFPL